MPSSDMPRRPRLNSALVKVPEITALFWVLKLLTTGIGETTSDFLAKENIALAALIGVGGIILALRLQFRQPGYSASHYWFTVLMVAVFGTMVADGIRIGAGLTFVVTTPLFALITAGIFLAWYRSEGTLSIHSIDTPRRERFYWSAVLATFALGTAAGDLTAYSLNLGFWASVVLFGAIIAVPARMWRGGTMHPILAFWFAYVVTRPLGASIADGLSKATRGGFGLGDGAVSLLGLIAFTVLVRHLRRTRLDAPDPAEEVRAYAERERERLGLGLRPAADLDS